MRVTSSELRAGSYWEHLLSGDHDQAKKLIILADLIAKDRPDEPYNKILSIPHVNLVGVRFIVLDNLEEQSPPVEGPVDHLEEDALGLLHTLIELFEESILPEV